MHRNMHYSLITAHHVFISPLICPKSLQIEIIWESFREKSEFFERNKNSFVIFHSKRAELLFNRR